MPVDDHRAARVVHDLVADRSEQEADQTALPVRADDE
jgi:hypothetical protein